MRTPRLTLLCCLLFAAALPLRAEHTVIDEVRISVVDPRTDRELEVLEPGDTLQLPEGEERVLRLFTLVGTRNQERRPLAASFGFGPVQTAVQLVSEDRDRGEAVVRLRDGRWSGQRLHIGYRLADSLRVADDLRLGRLLIEPAASSVAADRVVSSLYRAILLREPDAAAAQRRDDIARHGYEAVVRHAVAIAESRESEIDVYGKGVCNQQRLLAMYQHLLGRQPSSIDQRLWRQQLDHLDRGDIAGVVEELVESRDFRDRFDLRPRLARRGG